MKLVVTPGPGSYDGRGECLGRHPDSTVKSATAYSFPNGRPKPLPRSDQAGPAQYFPSLDSTHTRLKSAGGHTFGNDKRVLSEPSKGALALRGPEPSAQKDNASFKEGPKFGFGSTPRKLLIPGAPASEPRERTVASQDLKHPGPGTYFSQQTVDDKDRTLRMRSIVRYLDPRRDAEGDPPLLNPGPGQYGFEEDKGVAGKFGKSPRAKIGIADRGLTSAAVSTTPGPGNYDIAINNQGEPVLGECGNKFSMTKKGKFELPALC